MRTRRYTQQDLNEIARRTGDEKQQAMAVRYLDAGWHASQVTSRSDGKSIIFLHRRDTVSGNTTILGIAANGLIEKNRPGTKTLRMKY